METNEDKIEYLKKISEGIIIHYLKNNFYDKDKLETEIERIQNIIKDAKVSIRNYIPGSPTRGSNGNDGIKIYVEDKDNISLEELDTFIAIIIHEFYHSISKVNPKINYIFLEEGYVSQITAETIRYVIDDPTEIGDIKKEELVEILKKQSLKNGYYKPSEFVRSTQVIMQKFGYNSMFEYMFSENGVTRLYEIAKEISPEFEDIMKKQKMKNTESINYVYEQEFFKKMFEEIDFSNISETTIEMNDLLQKYLVDSKLIYSDSKLYDLVIKHNPEYVIYKNFYKENCELSSNELFAKIKDEVDKFNFDYQTENNRAKDIKKMIEIIDKGYEKSAIKPNMFYNNYYFGQLIAYDMYQRKIQSTTDKDVEEYGNFLVYDSESEKLLLDIVISEFKRVCEECNNRKKYM